MDIGEKLIIIAVIFVIIGLFFIDNSILSVLIFAGMVLFFIGIAISVHIHEKKQKQSKYSNWEVLGALLSVIGFLLIISSFSVPAGFSQLFVGIILFALGIISEIVGYNRRGRK